MIKLVIFDLDNTLAPVGKGTPKEAVEQLKEIEKQGIIDSARTQYLVEQTSRNTQEMTLAGINALGTKIDFYEYQNLRDQLAAERAKNNGLQLMAYIESKDCNINRRLDAIQCQMLKQPPIWGQSFVCSGESIPPVTTTTAG